MLFGVPLSRNVKAARHSAITRVSVRFAVIVALNLVVASTGLAQNSSEGEGDHNKENECPPETRQPIKNCDDVRRIAYKNAIRRGYADNDGNGTPDVMERTYQRNWNDCTTGNAHVACMFNDECTEEHGSLKGNRSDMDRHASAQYVGKNGQSFECDFTPQSSGIFIADNPDTRRGTAFPDPGESMDPQYARDGCPLNGANTSLVNPGGGIFGGGGSGSMDMAMMLAIMQMLNGGQNQTSPQSAVDGEPASNEVVIPTPTPTPTPTPSPEPTRNTATQASSSKSSTVISDAAIVSPQAGTAQETSADVTHRIEGGIFDDEQGSTKKSGTAEWEVKREGLF
jgi:hypothetical protein